MIYCIKFSWLKLFWFSFLILSFWEVSAQSTRIRGVVTDAETHEILPYVNVVFKNTTIGTITNVNGEYFLETRLPVDSLVVSFIGYITKKIVVQPSIFQTVSVGLVPESFELDEVVIHPGENPAHRILREIIAHKSFNSMKSIPKFSCEIYNKLQLDLTNIDEKTMDRKIFNQFKFVFNNIDTNVVTGKTYLPVLISESVSDYYYQDNPRVEREIIKANKISGTNNESVAQFSGRLYQKFTIYDNFVTILEPGFVSPVADFGLRYYKYYLIDSAYIGNKWCYHITFKPIRKQERTFTGDFWVNDTTFALKKFKIEFADDVNINFINELIVSQEFTQLNNKEWLLEKEEIYADFYLTNSITGFFGRKSTLYNNYDLNPDKENKLLQLNTNVVVGSDAMSKPDSFWLDARPYKLSRQEENIYQMVDSIKNVPLYKNVESAVNLLVNYYFVKGKFEIGPYYTFYSFNPIEGHRFRFGGRTSNDFSNKLMLDGYAAYGTLDEKLKYGGGFLYMFDKSPRMSLSMHYTHDIKQLSQSSNAFLEDNILSSFLRRNPNRKLTMVDHFSAVFEREWNHGFSNNVSFNYKNIFPGPYVPFIKPNTEDTNSPQENIIASEISLFSRYAWQEKFLMGEFERVSLGSKYPIVSLDFTLGLKGLLGAGYTYQKLRLNVSDKLDIPPIGFFKWQVDAGKIFGTVPYPLLELHKGNETYAFDYFAFNMMNYYEFASDTWAGVFVEHHFLGFFLNHIPLMRKLKWRELVSARGLIGQLDNRHQSVLLFPEEMHAVNHPYMEASVGLENIFKILRIDAMWRLTQLDHQNIQPFGFRAMLQITF